AAGFFQRREIVAVCEFLSFLLQPGFQEKRLQGGYRRALYLDMRIAPAGLGRSGTGRRQGRAGILLRNIDAAGESFFSVDNQDLAVIAVVEPPAAKTLERIDRI